ncbi:DEAD/DEAH box helicase [Sutterella sp.]|uniref:DEAD/DEAH box helicase n=1 Tax=Sutterella sp. TaxID=1981025 RepID=UPI0026DF9E5B|nr:DEAD/DEAH box helicase [Sutterella sp.]MDO5530717.1 DEAD/DEAH box helicase [Sutterella sp.]
MATFSELGLSEQLVTSLSALGFEEPTPIQEAAIPAILSGKDVLGQAATGTGKTAAFALPLIERHALGTEPGEPVILVLTPTRELCLQVSESFHSYGRDAGLVVTPIYGGQEYGRQIRALKRGTHVIVATPGRALDHISRGTLHLESIKAVVLDEADEMLDLGFADELDAIFEALPGHVQTALFSATLPPRIAKIADEHLVDPEHISIAREETPEGETPRVPQIAYVVPRNYRTAALGRILDLEDPELAIIFARTRNEVDELTEALRIRGYAVEALHGGLDQPTRDRVMRRARASALDAIVATDVAARGIDLENLTHVINFGIPASFETYVHRIGRTGRAGRTGTAITLLEPREHRQLRALERFTRSTIEMRTVPSATDVQAKRMEVIRGALGELLAAGDLDRYRVVVESLCEEHDPMDVAAAAVRFALESEGGAEDNEEIPAFAARERRERRDDRAPRGERGERGERPRRRELGTPEPGMTRLFIGAGRMSGIRPGDIVGAIANEANVSSRSIGAIEITERFTLADVESEIADQVIDALQGVRFKGRTVTVRLDNGGRQDREPREFREDRGDSGWRRPRDDWRDDRREGGRFDRFERDERSRGPRR